MFELRENGDWDIFRRAGADAKRRAGADAGAPH